MIMNNLYHFNSGHFVKTRKVKDIYLDFIKRSLDLNIFGFEGQDHKLFSDLYDIFRFELKCLKHNVIQ